VHYFGYGSLVNRDTRPANEPYETATLDGWVRQWAARVDTDDAGKLAQSPVVKGYSVLTVHPAEGVSIEGVQVPIDPADLVDLDQRELGYAQQSIETSVAADSVVVYVCKPENTDLASAEYPLLQSYIDCVLAGFLERFGWDGVDRFIDTTQGWSAPILDDRLTPLYARAVAVPDAVQAKFDSRIAAHVLLSEHLS